MNLLKLTTACATVAASIFLTNPAKAHTWNFGISSTPGQLTLFGVSYHGFSTGSVLDDFSAGLSGLTINGINAGYDIGSVIGLSGCNGVGGITTGSCDPIWNALGLDSSVVASSPSINYGKYATVTLDQSEWATYSLSLGNNSFTLGGFSNNVDWSSYGTATATATLTSSVAPVPLPAGGGLLVGALGLFGLIRRKAKAKQA